MPVVGNNNEPLLERAQFVFTGSIWVPLKSDANGNIEIVTKADQPIDARLKHYDGAAWRDAGLLFTYDDKYVERWFDGSLPAGASSNNFTQVSANEMWTVNLAIIWTNSATCTSLEVYAVSGGTFQLMLQQVTPTPNQTYPVNGPIHLTENEYMFGRINGATAGDDVRMSVFGYKMRLT